MESESRNQFHMVLTARERRELALAVNSRMAHVADMISRMETSVEYWEAAYEALESLRAKLIRRSS